jgi:type I restriction enzyme S subunit
MNQMPSNWQLLTLGDVANWTSGGTPSSKNSDYYDGEIPWVCIGDLNEGSVLETAKKITKAGLDSSSAKIMPKGTIMLAMYATSIGDTGMMETNMATNQAIACGVPNSEMIVGKYLLYYLQSQKHEFFAAGRGGAQPNINQGIVKSWPIPVPSIDEQHKIVELLEDHLSRLDAALADVKQAKIKAARFRQSLLNSVYFENEFPSVSLGTCIDLIMGQAPPGDTCNKDGKGTPFVKVGEFAKLYPTIEEWTLKPLRLAKTGDVLICVVGATVGKINLGIDCAIGRSVAAIRPKNILLQKYLYYFFELKMLEIRGQSKGSAQGVITKDYINSIQIPLPDLSAQQAILNLLESNFSQIEKSIEVSENIERESLSLRRSLLQAAFTGQLAKEVVSV